MRGKLRVLDGGVSALAATQAAKTAETEEAMMTAQATTATQSVAVGQTTTITVDQSFAVGDGRQAQLVEARIKGYEGDPCTECGNFTLVRNGTCLKCDTCGGTSGCS